MNTNSTIKYCKHITNGVAEHIHDECTLMEDKTMNGSKTFVYDLHMPLILQRTEEMEEIENAFADASSFTDDVEGLKQGTGLTSDNEDGSFSSEMPVLEYVNEEYVDEEGIFHSPWYDKEELALLNMKVTPKVDEVIGRAVIAEALTDVTKFTRDREENKTQDAELALDKFISLLPLATMSRTALEEAVSHEPLKKACMAAYEDLDSWVKRFNKFKESGAIDRLPCRVWECEDKKCGPATCVSSLWRAYKAKLKILKAQNKAAKEAWFAVKESSTTAWETWNTVQERIGQIKPTGWVWTAWYAMEEDGLESEHFLIEQYVNLLEEEVHPYFTNGESDDVDEGELIIHCPKISLRLVDDNPDRDRTWYDSKAIDYTELMDDLFIAHRKEMRAEEVSEYDVKGKGFWDWKKEKEMLDRMDNDLEASAFMDQLDQMMVA